MELGKGDNIGLVQIPMILYYLFSRNGVAPVRKLICRIGFNIWISYCINNIKDGNVQVVLLKIQ